MKYLLDTNVFIDMFRGNSVVRSRMLKAGFEECACSAITYAEILTGCYYSGYEAHKHEIDFLQENFTIVPVEPSIPAFARLRADLMKSGTPVDGFDLLIATAAIENNLVLVTHNSKHFSMIPGLKLTDWR